MKDKLNSLGIEFQDQQKYYTTCPACAQHRKKSGARSLSVSLFENSASVKCLHSTECEYAEPKVITKESDGIREVQRVATQVEKFIYIPEDLDIPAPEGSIKYKYCDTLGNILFYVIRTKDKKFFPLALNEHGELIAKKPTFRTLYGAELLSKDDRPVIVVEGEKAADAARKLFTSADVVTWIGGAANVESNPWNLIAGREIILWPDNDAAGIEAMNKLSTILDSTRISIIDVSSLPAKADLADNISKEVIGNLYKERKHVKVSVLPDSLSLASFQNQMDTVEDRDGWGFSNIDKHMRMPRSGLVIIEGRSGHGKSVFMINSAVRMLRNTDRKVVFVSYEVPETAVALRMLMAMEEVEKSPIAFENERLYIEGVRNQDLNTYGEFSSYLNSRLWITDKNLALNDLKKYLDTDKLHGAIIYLDYIQLIPAGTGNNSRYLVIKDIADTLREIANRRNQIIMTGSQLTDGETPYQDVAREGKDITNASEVTLKVWNKDVASATEIMKKKKDGKEELMEHYYGNSPGNFAVSVKKSRVGAVGKTFGFNLLYGCLIKEIESEYKDF